MEKDGKDLNKNIQKKKDMEILEKRVYKILKYYMRTRNEILQKNNKNKYSPEFDIGLRLEKQGYVNLKKLQDLTSDDKLNLFHSDYAITLKGYEEFCRLREKYGAKITLSTIILTTIFAFISLIIAIISLIVALK